MKYWFLVLRQLRFALAKLSKNRSGLVLSDSLIARYLFVEALALALLVAAPVRAEDPRVLNIDSETSVLRWTGKKLTGQHHGTVKLRHGQVTVQGTEIIAGKFDVDMASIEDLDLKDPKYNAKLVGHLKSEDFFQTARYPLATFVITRAVRLDGVQAGEPNYQIVGDLTILGTTNPISFAATIGEENGYAVAKGKVTVDRTKWNVRYGSGKFFEGLGDKLIYDEFTVDLEIRAKL